MSSEWCPQCQKLQNMNVSINTVEETTDNGETIKITVRSYSCAHCHLFVRSEEGRLPILESV